MIWKKHDELSAYQESIVVTATDIELFLIVPNPVNRGSIS